MIVVLTGAGVSRESGLHTFRDPDGIWAMVRIEDVATPEAFSRDPVRVNEFYNQRRRQLLSPEIQPNAAHHALVTLEERWPGGFVLITQNIDDLHERAGSNNVIHIHGELLRARCGSCGATAGIRDDLNMDSRCPACTVSGKMRPDVVWFGEMPYRLEEIFQHLGSCSLFAAIGTSGHVYPAAMFVTEAARGGAHAVEINLEPSMNADAFAESLYGPAGEVVPRWVAGILGADR